MSDDGLKRNAEGDIDLRGVDTSSFGGAPTETAPQTPEDIVINTTGGEPTPDQSGEPLPDTGSLTSDPEPAPEGQVTDEVMFQYLSEKLGKEVSSLDDLVPPTVDTPNPLDKDEELKALAEWRERTGRPVSDWVSMKSKNFEEMEPEELAREILQNRYPDFTKEELDYEMSKYLPGDDEFEDQAEKVKRSVELKKLLKSGLPELEAYTKQFNEPIYNNAPDPEVEAQQAAFAQGVQEATGNLSAVKLQLAEGVDFDFSIGDSSKKALGEFMQMTHWVGEDGGVDYARVVEDYTFLQNKDAIIQAVYAQGMSAGIAKDDKQGRNVTLDTRTPLGANDRSEGPRVIDQKPGSHSRGGQLTVKRFAKK